MRRKLLAVLSVVLAVGAVQVGSWLGVARDNLQACACLALVTHHYKTANESLPRCVVIQPRLYDRAPMRLRRALEARLDELGVELRIVQPSRYPLAESSDPHCIQYFAEGSDKNFPGLSSVVISYYTSDYNGDRVVMLQVGPAWRELTIRNLWF